MITCDHCGRWITATQYRSRLSLTSDKPLRLRLVLAWAWRGCHESSLDGYACSGV